MMPRKRSAANLDAATRHKLVASASNMVPKLRERSAAYLNAPDGLADMASLAGTKTTNDMLVVVRTRRNNNY
jgi:hypothetical protein